MPKAQPLACRCLWNILLAGLFLLSGGCVAGTHSPSSPPEPKPEPLLLSAELRPGLEAFFRYSMYRNVNEMPSNTSMIDEGQQGAVVTVINHRFKRNIFDSKSDTGVGVLLVGYIKLEKTGEYLFKAMSNDGVRVAVNGEAVVLDPTVHSDRFSAAGAFVVETPGWYPLAVRYFQRKGTARLELHWRPPGEDGFSIVPAGAYGHRERLSR